MIKTLLSLSILMIPIAGNASELLPENATSEVPVGELRQMQNTLQDLSVMINKIQNTQSQINHQIAIRMQEAATKNIHWINYKDSIPAKERVNANLSDSKQPIYICQAMHGDLGLHPGQIINKECVITYGGNQFAKQEYNVLTSTKNLNWRSSLSALRESFFDPYPGAVELAQYQAPNIAPDQYRVFGGYEKNHSLMICRGIYNNAIHVGKVVNSSCNIAGDNKEIELHDFEVLFN